jgi:hypothetical protein
MKISTKGQKLAVSFLFTVTLSLQVAISGVALAEGHSDVEPQNLKAQVGMHSITGVGDTNQESQQIFALKRRLQSLHDQVDTLSVEINAIEDRVATANLKNKNTALNHLIQKKLTDTILSIHEDIISMIHADTARNILISSN